MDKGMGMNIEAQIEKVKGDLDRAERHCDTTAIAVTQARLIELNRRLDALEHELEETAYA